MKRQAISGFSQAVVTPVPLIWVRGLFWKKAYSSPLLRSGYFMATHVFSLPSSAASIFWKLP